MRTFLVGVLFTFAATALAQEPDRHAALARAYDEVLSARAVLQEAEAAREKGVEPLPGERLGTAGDYSRLAPVYWERQERLEKDVESARARLDEALARWNALR